MKWDWITDSSQSLPIPSLKEMDYQELVRRLKEIPLDQARNRIMRLCVQEGIDQFYNLNETIGDSFRGAIINAIWLLEDVKC